MYRCDRDSVWIATRPDSPYLYLCWYDPARRKTRWKSCRTTDRAAAEKAKAAFLLGATHVTNTPYRTRRPSPAC